MKAVAAAAIGVLCGLVCGYACGVLRERYRSIGSEDGRDRYEAVATHLEGQVRELTQQVSTAELAVRERAARPVDGDGSRLSVDVVDEALVRRVEHLEGALEEMRASRAPDHAGATDADTIAFGKLSTQVLDTTLSMRVRLESLELLTSADASKSPLAQMTLPRLFEFIAAVPGPTWRRKAYRYCRPHVDEAWVAELLRVVQAEQVDEVRAQIVELMARLSRMPVVRNTLVELSQGASVGELTRQAAEEALQ